MVRWGNGSSKNKKNNRDGQFDDDSLFIIFSKFDLIRTKVAHI